MVIGDGLCSDTGATAFNGSYVGTVRSGAIGQEEPFTAALFQAAQRASISTGSAPIFSTIFPLSLVI